MKSNTKQQLITWTLVSLTLGLAPFVPEPHILGKLRWVAGGAKGMAAMDWFDFALHGFPWVVLGYWIYRLVREMLTK
jgi:hypothetical protein